VDKIYEYLNIVFMHLLNHILMFSLPALILFLREDIDLSYATSGYLWTILITIMTVMSLVTGTLADRHPERRYHLIYLGLFVMILCWFLLRYGTSVGYFASIFALFGLGASAFHPPSFAMITGLYEQSKARALSLNMVTGMLGTAISPFLFANIVEFSGSWQSTTTILASVFLIIGSLSALLAFRSSTQADVTAVENAEDGDIISSPGKSGVRAELSFILSPLILIPLLFISLRSSFFRVASLFTSLIYEDYLDLSKYDATIATGLVLGISSLFILVGGTLSDKTHPKFAILTSSFGTLGFATSLVFFADLTSLFSFSANYGALLAFFYIGSPAASALLANRAGKKQRGMVFGASFSLGQILGVVAPSIFGSLETNYDLSTAFVFLAILSTIAFLIGVYIYFEENRRNGHYKVVYKG
jgi:MFS family permease